MRFGQISPNLSAKTESSVKNLIAARNMKNQAMRGIVGFVNKAADEKIQKEKDAASLERATALIEQVQAAYPTNVAIQNLDPNTVGKELGKEGIGLINMLAQADLTRQQSTAQIEAAKAAKELSDYNNRVAVAKEQERLLGIKEEEINQTSLDMTVSEFYNKVRKTDEEGKTVIEMPTATERYNFLSDIVDEQIALLPPEQRGIVDRDDVIRESLKTTYDIGSKESSIRTEELQQRISSFELNQSILSNNIKSDDLARSGAQGLNKVARATDNNLIQIDSIIDDAQDLTNLIQEFVKKEGGYSGEGPFEITPKMTDSLRASITKDIKGSIGNRIKNMASQLAGKLGVDALMALRETSVDGSSGFGQLTGIELQGLQGLVGVLGTIEENKFTPVDLNTMTRTLDNVKSRFVSRKQAVLFDFEASYGDLMNQSGLYPRSEVPAEFGVRRGFSVLGFTAVPLN